jgi:hypothetical protein
MRLSLSLAALAVTTAFATPAFAQTTPITETNTARGLIIQPLTFVRLTDLNFGTIVSTATAGTVTVSPNGDTRSSTGGVVLAPSGQPTRGLFEGYGTPGQNVVLSAAFPTALVNQSDTTQSVAFSSGTFDGSLTRTIPLSGTFRVGVGGTIAVGANQLAGLYTAQFTVTADYQ